MKKMWRKSIVLVLAGMFISLIFPSIVNENEIGLVKNYKISAKDCIHNLASNGNDDLVEGYIFADFRYDTEMYTVTFNASRSYNLHYADITNYSWDFQDDGVYDKWGKTANWTYNKKGTYTVKLRAQNIDGDTDIKKYLVDVPTSYIILTELGTLEQTKYAIGNCTKGYDIWLSGEMANFLPNFDALLYKVGDLSADSFKDMITSVSNVYHTEQNYPCFRSEQDCQSDWEPNDPRYNEQWNLEMINCPAAWNITKGDYNNVTVSVVDSGVDYTHSDLSECIWINEDEIPGNGIDDDNNGFVDDVRGWNFCYLSDGNESKDDLFHGTHCAGIIGAHMNNSIGISGIAKTKIMSVKAINAFGGGYLWAICCGIVYSVKNGANIISLSLGFDSIFPSSVSPRLAILKWVCDWAYNQDCIIISSSGNDYMEEPGFPARFDSVISVGAVDKNGNVAEFSNGGVDVLAPGVSVLSTMPSYTVIWNFFINNCTGGNFKRNYDYCSGTSMACPHVAGVAALIKAKYPDKKASWIKNKIIKSVDSRGIIDAYKAVMNDTNDYYFSAGFPSGTKITMNDGVEENIENLKIGQKVLSYDVINDKYDSWSIIIVVKTMNSLISINNGFIQATVDHPLYIKKPDGSEGWGAYDTTDIEKAIMCNGNFLKLEVGDQLLSEDGKWVEIENIKYSPNLVKTYNIISFSGKRTYFANDVLVYEKHSPHIITNYLLYLLKQRFTILEQLIKSMPFFSQYSNFFHG